MRYLLQRNSDEIQIKCISTDPSSGVGADAVLAGCIFTVLELGCGTVHLRVLSINVR